MSTIAHRLVLNHLPHFLYKIFTKPFIYEVESVLIAMTVQL